MKFFYSFVYESKKQLKFNTTSEEKLNPIYTILKW